MCEEDTICRISTSPVADIMLATRSAAVVDWNCMRSVAGFKGFAVGLALGFPVDGFAEGFADDGFAVDGFVVGSAGDGLDFTDGWYVGIEVGPEDGSEVGPQVGIELGLEVG